MKYVAFPAAMLVLASMSVQASAQQSGATEKDGVVTSHQFVKTSHGEKEVTCSGFIGLEDRFKPEAISYAIGYNRAKRPDDAVIDVSGVDALVPVVVSECVTTPAQSLHQAVAKAISK
jgi:hypothetical protein